MTSLRSLFGILIVEIRQGNRLYVILRNKDRVAAIFAHIYHDDRSRFCSSSYLFFAWFKQEVLKSRSFANFDH